MGSNKTDGELEVLNPVTGRSIAQIPIMGLDDVRQAIERAHTALPTLQALGVAKRSKLLVDAAAAVREQAESLAATMTDETGKPIRGSRGEVNRAALIFELVASEVRNVFEGRFIPLEGYDYPPGNQNRLAFVKREPVGVVCSITPFNFPAASFAHKVAPALAVGNTVVHKPTVFAPLTQMALAKIMLEVGFPEGSVNVVTGRSGMIGDEFVRNPDVSLITFTGSEKVGLELASKAVANAKKVIMELGGSDAEIVLDDADIQKAAAAAAIGRFDYAGQFCNATKRVIVRTEVRDAFVSELIRRVGEMKIGDPRKEETDIGPLISRDAVQTMKELVDDASGAGAAVVYQGKVPSAGFFFPPTILMAEKPLRVTTEEVFGPVFPVTQVAADDDAVEIANSTPYGLDASIFTKDFGRAYRLASKLKVGTVMINDMTRLRWDNVPFGGAKRSGIGRESVRDTMMEMTETKAISYNFG